MSLKENLSGAWKSAKRQMVCRTSQDDGYVDGIPPRRSTLQLVTLGAAVCGIEFCYAAETAFVSPALLKIGVPVAFMSLVWCISPLAGIISVPILGSLSDGCRSRMGRRRPFIVALSVVICVGLMVVPNARRMGALLGDRYARPVYEAPSNDVQVYNTSGPGTTSPGQHPFGILFTIIGVVFLDFGCDACQSPCRAYLLDVLPPSDHSIGLSTFTVMAGLGGSLGYVLGGVDWQGGGDVGGRSGPLFSVTSGSGYNASNGSDQQQQQSVSDKTETVFALVFVIYLVCATITINSIKEVPLPRLSSERSVLATKKSAYSRFDDEEDDVDEEAGDAEDEEEEDGQAGTDTTSTEDNDASLKHIRLGMNAAQYGTMKDAQQMQSFDSSKVDKTSATLMTYLLSIVHMPRCIMVLCITNLFSWMSLVSYSLYFTHFVGQVVFKGDPMAPEGSQGHALYERGVRMGSLAMALYSISCSVYSLNIARLVNKYGAKRVYVLSQFVYTLGAAIMTVWHTKVAVFILSPCAGIMYATLFTMPYLMIASYHNSDMFEGQIRGIGTDVAVVSSMVFVAQFFLSACMGSIVQMVGTPIVIMSIASVLSGCAALSATQIVYVD